MVSVESRGDCACQAALLPCYNFLYYSTFRCENCVELLFVRGSGQCPQCNTNLRRNNFKLQFFEDASIEKEIEIRKRVLKEWVAGFTVFQ